MAAKTQTIEVDEATAEALRTRSAEMGISVAELLAKLAYVETAPEGSVSEQIAELDRRWTRHQSGAAVPNEKVVRWLETWGTSRFEPWRNAATN